MKYYKVFDSRFICNEDAFVFRNHLLTSTRAGDCLFSMSQFYGELFAFGDDVSSKRNHRIILFPGDGFTSRSRSVLLSVYFFFFFSSSPSLLFPSPLALFSSLLISLQRSFPAGRARNGPGWGLLPGDTPGSIITYRGEWKGQQRTITSFGLQRRQAKEGRGRRRRKKKKRSSR